MVYRKNGQFQVALTKKHSVGSPFLSYLGGCTDCHVPPLLYVMTVCIGLCPTRPMSSCDAINTPGSPSIAWKSANGSIPLKM